MTFTITFFLIFSVATISEAYLPEGIYCGSDNCYDVLGVTKEDDRNVIQRTYRKLARLYHPDRQKTVEDRLNAENKFRLIAAAYEILRDEEQRKEYDYMLDNPEEMYYHYYQYYKRRLGPTVDVRLVILASITLISIVQYYSQWSNYKEALNYLVKEPKYRLRAKEVAKKEGIFDESGSLKSKKDNRGRMNKEQVRAEEERVIREVIIEKMDIKGGYAKPTIKKTLWLQLFLWPVMLANLIYFWSKWMIVYWVLRKPYSEEHKLLIIQRYMSLPSMHWESLPVEEKEYYMKRELWKKEKFEVYRDEKQREMKAKLAEDNKYKRYNRYMKKGGAGQMVFGPEDAPEF